MRMNWLQKKTVVLAVLMFNICCSANAASPGLAATRTGASPLITKPVSPAATLQKPSTAALLPDLSVAPITPIGPLKDGQAIAPFTVTVRNEGLAASPITEFKVSCSVMEGAPGSVCPQCLSGSRSVPSLSAKGKQPDYVSFQWPASTGAAWAKGKYRLTLEIDPARLTKEANKSNNSRILDITVTGLSKPVISEVKAVTVTQAVKNMGKVNGTITGNYGGKNVVQWFGGKCENIKIKLLDESFAVVRSINATAAPDGCQFETMISSPRSYGIEAPASSGTNEFKWQYYQSWSSSDINNTTNIVLKDAGLKKLQMNVTPPDIKLKSIKTYPFHPSDIDNQVDVRVTMENKGQMSGSKKVYYKLVALSAADCGILYKCNEVLSADIKVDGGKTVEERIFAVGGKNLYNLKPGQYEITAGPTPSLTDSTAVHKKLNVSKAPLTVYETYPGSLTVGADNPHSNLYVIGEKFTPTSVILMRPSGSSTRIELKTIVPGGTSQTKPTELYGYLPYPIGDKPGLFLFWVKNPDGEISNSVELEVHPAVTGPPVIKDYYPRVITEWRFDPYNNKFVANVPTLVGDNLRGNDIKMTAAIVESDVPNPVPLILESNWQLSMKNLYNTMKKGVIEITLYRGDPSNAAQVRIPVDASIPVIGAPLITSPSPYQVFLSKDVVLRLQPPQGTASRKYRLDWTWEPDYKFSYLPVNVLDTVDLTGSANQQVVVSKDLFPGEGSYRVRARIAETDGAPTSNLWSEYVDFRVVRH